LKVWIPFCIFILASVAWGLYAMWTCPSDNPSKSVQGAFLDGLSNFWNGPMSCTAYWYFNFGVRASVHGVFTIVGYACLRTMTIKHRLLQESGYLDTFEKVSNSISSLSFILSAFNVIMLLFLLGTL
ncbi:hypothetical protein KIPB_013849, partial [Kipferlia bialata]